MAKWLSLFLSVVVLTLMGWSPSCDARTLQTEDYVQLQRVREPEISPDGKLVVYVRTKTNVLADRYEDERWIMDTDGSNDRPLMRGGAELHWSPDSTRIAYVEKTEHGNEVFLRSMKAGEGTIQITFQGQSPRNLKWSPDGRWIAFLARVPAAPNWGAGILASPKGAHWTDEPVIIDRLHYRLDGVGYTNDSYSHIFLVPASGGAIRQLTSGVWNAEPLKAGSPFWCGELEWTPDGKSILFSANISSNADKEYGRANLHAVDVASGQIRDITQGQGFWGMLPGPKVSPDGRRVAYLGMPAAGSSNYPSLELHLIGLDGSGDRTLIADIPGWVDYLQWDRKGDELYYVTGEAGTKNVYSVSLSGAVRPVTKGPQSLTLSSTTDAGVAVGTVATVYNPPDLVRLNLRDGRELHTLTAVNQVLLEGVKMGHVEEVWYTSTDNTKVQGWIMYPPDFDPLKKYPLILDIHGGPEWNFEGDFDFTHQDMAAHGYVVLYTNPRGSIGYGGAFARTIYDSWPGRVDYQDLMSGVDMVVGRGFVDTTRLYVQGCSGGGALTAWVVTQTDRFAGGAAMCSISDMISLAGTMDITAWVFNRYKKPFWEDPTAWLASSSIMKVNLVKTPTLVIVGEHDIRTPVAQSEEFYSGLKMVGVPTKLILFREESHGTETFKPSNVMRLQLYLRKWYEEWHRDIEDGKPVWRHH